MANRDHIREYLLIVADMEEEDGWPDRARLLRGLAKGWHGGYRTPTHHLNDQAPMYDWEEWIVRIRNEAERPREGYWWSDCQFKEVPHPDSTPHHRFLRRHPLNGRREP